jgi:hypothetical protein
MNLTQHVNRKQLAGGTASLLLALAIAAPVMATTAPTTASASPNDATTSVLCDTQWIAAKQSPSVTTVQAAGDCEVSRRLTTIANLKTGIASSQALSSSDRSALDDILDASHDGLVALQAKIDADTTLSAASADVKAVFSDYRVYALVARQVALVTGDDVALHAVSQLTTVAGDISAAIDSGQAAGKDESVAAGHLAAMQSAIAGATTALDGQAAKVLSLTPAEFNAGTAGPVLSADRAALVTARTDLRRAVTEAQAAVRTLK